MRRLLFGPSYFHHVAFPRNSILSVAVLELLLPATPALHAVVIMPPLRTALLVALQWHSRKLNPTYLLEDSVHEELGRA